MARQVVFGAKGSTAYILESAVAANLRLARSEVGSDGSAQVTSLPLTGAQTEIMEGVEAFTCLRVSVNSGVAPPPAKRLPAVVPGPPPVHALSARLGHLSNETSIGPLSSHESSVAGSRDQAWLVLISAHPPLPLCSYMDALAGQPYGGVFFVDGWPDKVVSIFKDPLGRVVIRHAVHGRTEHQVHEFVGRRAGTYHYKGFTGRATLGMSGCVVKLSWAKKTGDNTWKKKESWVKKPCKNLRAKRIREMGSDVD